jgi:hypothetical protein
MGVAMVGRVQPTHLAGQLEQPIRQPAGDPATEWHPADGDDNGLTHREDALSIEAYTPVASDIASW